MPGIVTLDAFIHVLSAAGVIISIRAAKDIDKPHSDEVLKQTYGALPDEARSRASATTY
jgi:hypothetical protein